MAENSGQKPVTDEDSWTHVIISSVAISYKFEKMKKRIYVEARQALLTPITRLSEENILRRSAASRRTSRRDGTLSVLRALGRRKSGHLCA